MGAWATGHGIGLIREAAASASLRSTPPLRAALASIDRPTPSNGGGRGARLDGIDAARGGAVLLVVMMHSAVRASGPLPTLLAWVDHAADGVRMPLLMFLSGFLSQSLLRDDRRALRRAADLAWVYGVWTALGALSSGWNLPELLLIPRSAFWYVWALAFASGTLPLARRLPRVVVVAAALALAMLSYAGVVQGEGATTDHLMRQIVFFYVGLYVGPWAVGAARRRPGAVVLASLALLAASHAVDSWATARLGVPLLAVPERGGAMLAVLAACLALPAAVTAPISWLGKRTLPVYVGHIVLIQPLWPFFGGLSPGLQVGAAAAVLVAVSLLAHRAALELGLDALYYRPGGGANPYTATPDLSTRAARS